MTLTPEIRNRHNKKIKENIKEHLRTIEHLLNTWMLLEPEVQSSDIKSKKEPDRKSVRSVEEKSLKEILHCSDTTAKREIDE